MYKLSRQRGVKSENLKNCRTIYNLVTFYGYCGFHFVWINKEKNRKIHKKIMKNYINFIFLITFDLGRI